VQREKREEGSDQPSIVRNRHVFLPSADFKSHEEGKLHSQELKK
jgi:hypothetical protein